MTRPGEVIALIDYGAGNLTSVRRGFAAAGAGLVTPTMPADLDSCGGIVVPGVGHFSATRALDEPWRDAIRRRIEAGVPLLGICLGMQWLFDGSDEAPDVPGLSLLRGSCSRISAERPLKVPHVGWNSLAILRASSMLEGIGEDTYAYFTHGFAAPVTADCTATSTHGHAFAAAVQREQVMGIQFHPEKSAGAGIRMLRNFVRIVRGA